LFFLEKKKKHFSIIFYPNFQSSDN